MPPLARLFAMLAASATAAALPLSAALTGSAAAAETAAPGIIQRSGAGLAVDGAPYRFTGYQIGLGASPAHPLCSVYDDASVGAALVQARDSSGANAVRVWMYQGYGGPTDWRRFDLVFAEARKAGVRVIATLTNQWGDCEPADANGRSVVKRLSWYQSGYRGLDVGYSASYRDFVRAMADRYRAEPALLAWQLVNEAETPNADGSCDQVAGRNALRAFSDDMVGVIRATGDPHLVNLGSMGGGQCGMGGSADFRYVHAGALDLCEYHDYTPMSAMPGDGWNGLSTRISDCSAVGKPLFVGEVGIARGIQADGSTGPVTAESLARRASLFDAKLTQQQAAGVVGFQVWQKALDQSDNMGVAAGDPLEAVLKKHAPAAPAATTPSTSPSPAPTTSPTTAPVSTSPVTSVVTTTLSGRTSNKGLATTTITTGAGPMTVGVRSATPLTLTVTVRNPSGLTLTTRTALTPYDISVTVPAGTQSISISGGRRVPFSLVVTYVAP